MDYPSNIPQRLAAELNVGVDQVKAAIALLDDGATVPFIARYRKEATRGLDDTQLRQLTERLDYLRELEARRQTILDALTAQGVDDPDLMAAIAAADTKTRLEDLYLPHRPKRRTKAQQAREAGLEPLAMTLLQDPSRDPEALAVSFVDPDHKVFEVKDALEGARHILMEHFAESAELRSQLRDALWAEGVLVAKVVADKAAEGAKFADYFAYEEPIDKIPSHRALALLRGVSEGVLTLTLTWPSPAAPAPGGGGPEGGGPPPPPGRGGGGRRAGPPAVAARRFPRAAGRPRRPVPRRPAHDDLRQCLVRNGLGAHHHRGDAVRSGSAVANAASVARHRRMGGRFPVVGRRDRDPPPYEPRRLRGARDRPRRRAGPG
ncbi:MAG: Tex-like N-terminal domain-containing protein, partial [Candidatus Competibacterales bacterium]